MLVNRIKNLCSLSGLRAGGLAGPLCWGRPGRGASVPRPAAELRPERERSILVPLLKGALVALALLPQAALGATTWESVVNRATLSTFQYPAVATAVTVQVVSRTPSTAEFLKYAPGVSGATGVPVAAAGFVNGSGALTPVPNPVSLDGQGAIDLSAPVPLLPYSTFHAGEPVFIRVTDLDQNLDSSSAQTIRVTVTDPATGDSEELELTESAPDSGVFIGYLQTVATSAVPNDGRLSVAESSAINVRYVDSVDGSDASADAALVDPFGIVFDSTTGAPVDGAVVELIDAATGGSAVVLGDNGLPGNLYPSRLVTGSTASDSQGRVYSFNPGGYRFPYVAPGNYILKVTPPESHLAPSVATTAALQALPGGPFTILEPGSRGEVFTVSAGPAIRVDIPVDPKPTLSLRKSAGKSTVSAGDFLSYEITLENSNPVSTVFSVVVTDRLPTGFRYRKGSARLNGAAVADPAVSPDGSTLTFTVGDIAAHSSALIRYVVGVGSGARPGNAVNTATAVATPVVASNTASAAVLVQEPFLQSRNIIMGRVFVGACSDNPEDNKKGMEGIGIYLEDGSFVISDKRGMFHFEGVRSGTHVVQLDIDSIPEGYRILPCEQNSRFAGRAYSQFVEMQGGTMWRTDFHLARSADAEGTPAEVAPETAPRAEGAADAQGGTLGLPTGAVLPAVAAVLPAGVAPVSALPGAVPGAVSAASAAGEGGTAAVAAAGTPVASGAQGAASSYKGEITLEMISSQSGDYIDYQIPLQSAAVPLENLQLAVILPPGAVYHKGGSSLDGAAIGDPQIEGRLLLYQLGSASADWHRELRFRTSMERNAQGGELQTRALLTFDSPSAKGVVAPEVDNLLTLVKEESRVALPTIMLRPQFPTFGAELSEADRKQLDDLALILSRFKIDSIQVTGHTDIVRIAPRSRKVYADNTALSFARARSVGRYLRSALRLPPERLNLDGKGERKPVASNRTEAGRALNRRVEVQVSLSQEIESSQLRIVKERSGVKKQETVGVSGGAGLGAQGAQPKAQGAQAKPQDGAYLVAAASVAAAGAEVAPVPAVPAGAALVSGAAALRDAKDAKESGEVKEVKRGKEAEPKKGEEKVELVSALNDGIVHYRIKLAGGKLPQGQVSATLTVPSSFLYMSGTSRLAGVALPDPEVLDNTISYRFPELPGSGKLDLRLQALLDGEQQSEAQGSSVTVTVTDSEGKPLKSYSATADLSDAMEEIERPELPATQDAAVQAEQGRESADDFIEKVAPKGAGAESANRDAGLHVQEEEGFLAPGDGAVLASQVNAVRVVLASGLTPVLTLDGKEIPADRIGFKMNDRESQKSLYTYLGVDFGGAGEHLLQLKGVDGFGVARFDKSVTVTRAGEIASLRLVLAEGNIADGRTPVRVRVELLDRDGKPVPANAELTLKGGELRPYSVSGNAGRDAGLGMVPVDAQGWITFQPVTASGLYRVQLAYNKALLDVETYVKPKMRDWILVGLAEGSVGYDTVSGHMENLKESGGQEGFFDEERLAFYAKGTIKGEWLLTMSYDSDKKSTGVDGNALFQQIDPNAFYTIYGDATSQGYEAASQRKLFLKIERDQFYAMFGDYETGLTVTELSRYSRRMNGIKSEFRSRQFEITAFGSETGQAFVKDEIRGDGTSGLYRLSRPGIVFNSEKISIETRDRLHSEKVVDSRPMSRFIDYSIDYQAGTIFFKGPVASRDQWLNPIYIVVDYEIADAGADALTYGGRAGMKLFDETLRVGATYIHEGHINGDANLYGADATLNLGAGTKARAEIATSDSDTALLRGGGNAYLAEITHDGKALEGKAYFREQEEGFGLGQQMGSEAGTRKFGAEADYKLNSATVLSAQAYRQYNLTGGNVRDFIEAAASYNQKEITSRVGLRYAKDHLADGGDPASILATVGASWKTLNQRLTLRADHEQALFRKDENADFPTRTILGADFQLNKEVLLFAQEELTFGAAAETNTTRVGLKATPWSGGTVASSVVNDMNEHGDRTFANVGLAQKWQLTPAWTVDGGLDHNRTIRKKKGYQFDLAVPPTSGGEDFTAVSLGANYQERKLVWSNRVEYRDGETENKWGLITGVMNEQGLYWGWTGRLQYLQSRTSGGISRSDADLRLGVAYRPPVTRWIVLDRLDLVATDEKSGAESSRGRRIVNNLNANFRPDRRSQISLQYGAKYVLEEIDEEEYGGYTDLVGIEARYDLSRTWDLGLRASVLHSWEMKQVSYSLGPSVGCNLMENAWLSLGYNLLGFRDKDFSAANFTSQGPYVQFRFKFDQNSVKDGLVALNRE